MTARRPRPQRRPVQKKTPVVAKAVGKPVRSVQPKPPVIEAPKASLQGGAMALVGFGAQLDFEHASCTSMFDTLGAIRALPTSEASRAICLGSLKEARGYTNEQIEALCQVGYHYLRSGGYRLALAIFEGLAAIDPKNAWVQLALGLAHDGQGDRIKARAAYLSATKLDPRDATPLVNLAELDLEAGDFASAKKRLLRAQKVSATSKQAVLQRKTNALLRSLARRRRPALASECRL